MATEDETMYEGGCLCGAIRYAFRGPLIGVSQCCCRDCQKATGTGHTTIVAIRKSQLSVSGEPRTFTVDGESGNDVTRHFCGTCASRLYTGGGLLPDVVMVQSGTLDDPNQVSPQNVIYMKDAVSWDRFDPALPKYEAMPPLPGM